MPLLPEEPAWFCFKSTLLIPFLKQNTFNGQFLHCSAWYPPAFFIIRKLGTYSQIASPCNTCRVCFGIPGKRHTTQTTHSVNRMEEQLEKSCHVGPSPDQKIKSPLVRMGTSRLTAVHVGKFWELLLLTSSMWDRRERKLPTAKIVLEHVPRIFQNLEDHLWLAVPCICLISSRTKHFSSGLCFSIGPLTKWPTQRVTRMRNGPTVGRCLAWGRQARDSWRTIITWHDSRRQNQDQWARSRTDLKQKGPTCHSPWKR